MKLMNFDYPDEISGVCRICGKRVSRDYAVISGNTYCQDCIDFLDIDEIMEICDVSDVRELLSQLGVDVACH